MTGGAAFPYRAEDPGPNVAQGILDFHFTARPGDTATKARETWRVFRPQTIEVLRGDPSEWGLLDFAIGTSLQFRSRLLPLVPIVTGLHLFDVASPSENLTISLLRLPERRFWRRALSAAGWPLKKRELVLRLRGSCLAPSEGWDLMDGPVDCGLVPERFGR